MRPEEVNLEDLIVVSKALEKTKRGSAKVLTMTVIVEACLIVLMSIFLGLLCSGKKR